MARGERGKKSVMKNPFNRKIVFIHDLQSVSSGNFFDAFYFD